MRQRTDIIIPPALEQAFSSAWDECRVILFSAPCGFGKSATADILLQGHMVFRADGAEEASLARPIASSCGVVLVDNLQALYSPARQQALCDAIRARRDLRFVLLSRGRLPGYLMPFQLAGTLRVLEGPLFLLDRASSQKLLAAGGASVAPDEVATIHEDTRGYPVALALLLRQMRQSGGYSPSVLGAAKRDLFVYFDQSVFRGLSAPLRSLLMCLALFEPFHADLARMLSGDARAGELLEQLLADTTMILYAGEASYRFWPAFRAFLLWERERLLPGDDAPALYARAALYYELHGEYDRALDCYAQAGEHRKVSALLERNAQQHPGSGHYYEMERYYYAIPEPEVRRSPSLMCAMSMLCAMNMDFDTSDGWYAALADYLSTFKKSDAEYRIAREKIAYLDIALPQRPSQGLIERIKSVFRAFLDGQLTPPAFSVTSTLPSVMNGGKDFCAWSAKDDLLYHTMRASVEGILGKDGVGLADLAICESKFEKGKDVAPQMLTLMGRLGEIQARGTPDIEFAVMGLWVRMQTMRGKAAEALKMLESLRDKYAQTGQGRFLPNLDALRCRIWLRLGNANAAQRWLSASAPRDEAKLRTMWRYQYLTRAMAQIANNRCDEALLVLARLLPYCERCGRVMDGVYIRVLMAICLFALKDEGWKASLCAALDVCHFYAFITPIAQHGAAVLPLLPACGWQGDAAYLAKLTSATRAQAVHYPNFLSRPAAQTQPLSAAETQVLKLLCHNKSNAEIAETLGVKVCTVKTHVNRILAKLGAKRRSEAREIAQRLGLFREE